MRQTIQSILFFLVCITGSGLLAQVEQNDSLKPYLPLNYQRPAKYVIGGLEVEGITYFDPNIVKLFSGLYTGQEITIPGDEITKAIENLWSQKLFTNVQILLARVEDNKVYLRFVLQENPRLFEFEIRGLKKSKAKSLREDLSLRGGDMITDNLKQRTVNEIETYYIDKGYLNVKVEVTEEEAEGSARKNMKNLVFDVKPGIRTKIGEIVFDGNVGVSDKNFEGQCRKPNNVEYGLNAQNLFKKPMRPIKIK